MGMIDSWLSDDTLSAAADSFDSSFHVRDKNCMQFILQDNYDFIVRLHQMKTSDGRPKIRDFCFDQIQKAILCGTTDLGYTVYECTSCGRYNIIPNRCHSHFCPSCAVKKARMTAIELSETALDCKHRHVVLTIPQELRDYFIRDRSLLNLLFIAARNTIYAVANDSKFRKKKRQGRKNRKKKSPYAYKDEHNRIIPGFIATLHTYGRDLKWNPHIHILCSEKCYDSRKDRMKSLYFPYEKIRKTWQYMVLTLMAQSDALKGDRKFMRLKNQLYRTKKNGFYIYAPDMQQDIDDDCLDDDDCVRLTDNIRAVVGYITRYTSRPVIADSRIDDYDEESKTVSWNYTAHEDNKIHHVRESAKKFIISVIRHCPDKNFKMTRRYGYYSNASSRFIEHIYEIYSRQTHRKLKGKKQRRKSIDRSKRKCTYRMSMILSFKRDPIKCTCGGIMVPTYNYNPYEKGPAYQLLRRNRKVGKETGSKR